MKYKSLTKENKILLHKFVALEHRDELVKASKTNKEFTLAIEVYKSMKEITKECPERDEYLALTNYEDKYTFIDEHLELVDFIPRKVVWKFQKEEKTKEFERGISYRFSNLVDIIIQLDPMGTFFTDKDWYAKHSEAIEEYYQRLEFREKLKKEEKAKSSLTLVNVISKLKSNTNLRLHPNVIKSYLENHNFANWEDFWGFLKKDNDKNLEEAKVLNYVEWNNYADKYVTKVQEKFPNVKPLTYESMVKDYFGIDIEVGLNKPKLSKQLSKKGIEATEAEIRAFGEVWKWFKDMYALRQDINVADIPRFKKIPILFVDDDVDTIPEFVEYWAFAESCNHLGSAGQDTHRVFREIGGKMLKGYHLAKLKGNLYLVNGFRTYFLEENGEVGHAGTYASMATRNDLSKTAYSFTDTLLALKYGKKVDDFQDVFGYSRLMQYEGLLDSDGRYLRVWSNLTNTNGYTKRGTKEDIMYNKTGYIEFLGYKKLPFKRLEEVWGNMSAEERRKEQVFEEYYADKKI